MAKFHAIVWHNLFSGGREVQLHSVHRTQAAAARSLSKGITAARKPGPGYNTYCVVVAPNGDVMSLRMAQGKDSQERTLWEGLIAEAREIAAQQGWHTVEA